MRRFLSVLLVCVLCAVLAAPGWAAMSDGEFLALCYKGTPEEIRAALEAGANVNARGEYLYLYDWCGTGPRSLHSDGILGLTVARDNSGWTALMWAAEYNSNPEVIDVLLKAGADVNAKDQDGQTALMSAARYNSNPEAVKEALI